jgi:hypothetical protein
MREYGGVGTKIRGQGLEASLCACLESITPSRVLSLLSHLTQPKLIPLRASTATQIPSPFPALFLRGNELVRDAPPNSGLAPSLLRPGEERKSVAGLRAKFTHHASKKLVASSRWDYRWVNEFAGPVLVSAALALSDLRR